MAVEDPEDPWCPSQEWGVQHPDGAVVRLRDGRILYAGDTSCSGYTSRAAALFDPVSGGWSVLPDMPKARGMAKAVALPDGSALLVGKSEDAEGYQRVDALRFVPVSAATVKRYRVPSITTEDDGCGFLVVANATINNESETDTYDDDGNLVKVSVTGHLVIAYENPANGKSIVENVSGSAHIDLVNGTFVIVGRDGFIQTFNGRLDLFHGTFADHMSNETCEALA